MKPEEQLLPINTEPRSVHELITRQMVMDMKDDVAEIRGRVNALLFAVAGAIIIQVVLALVKL